MTAAAAAFILYCSVPPLACSLLVDDPLIPNACLPAAVLKSKNNPSASLLLPPPLLMQLLLKRPHLTLSTHVHNGDAGTQRVPRGFRKDHLSIGTTLSSSEVSESPIPAPSSITVSTYHNDVLPA